MLLYNAGTAQDWNPEDQIGITIDSLMVHFRELADTPDKLKVEYFNNKIVAAFVKWDSITWTGATFVDSHCNFFYARFASTDDAYKRHLLKTGFLYDPISKRYFNRTKKVAVKLLIGQHHQVVVVTPQ